MSEPVRPRKHMTVELASRPTLPRHVTLRHDSTRDRWVLLVPERVLVPDEIAVQILQLCDGRSVAEMVEVLAQTFAAPAEVIATDVVTLLQDLADKGFLIEKKEKADDRVTGS